MSQQSQATRTECGANSQLSRSRRRANELKVGQVCARDQQYKTCKSKREPHDSSADVVRHGSLKRLESQALAFIRRILFVDISGQSNHTLLRLLNCDAWLEASNRREIVVAAVRLPFRSKGEWLPDIDWAPKDRMFESGRHHADYLDCLSVELNRASDYVWVASKTARPKTIGQDDDVVSARLKLFRFEYTAARRSHFQHGKEIGGCLRG